MISFRFHLVSLVAVFLALGLGVLTGTTVLNRGIVAQLERQTDSLAQQSAELRQEVGRLQEESAVWAEFGSVVMEELVGGSLSGVEVLLVTQEGTDSESVGEVRQALEVSGAALGGEVIVRARMRLEAEEDVAALAQIVGSPAAAPAEEVLEAAAEEVADRLAFGRGFSGGVLDRLAAADFLRTQGQAPAETAGSRGESDPVVVVVAGGRGEPTVDPSAFLVPLATRLALDGEEVAASEAADSEYPFVTVLRDSGAADRVVTQDNVDQLPGAVGLILALEELLEDGRAGHYGTKAGAVSLLPAL